MLGLAVNKTAGADWLIQCTVPDVSVIMFFVITVVMPAVRP